MKASNLRRRLTHLALAGGLAAALVDGIHAQDRIADRPPGRGLTIANPVPQGHGWINPRRPDVGQGDGEQFSTRRDRDRRGNPRVRYHQGIDLAAPVGTPVRAPVSGTVIRSVPDWHGQNDNGNEVRILGDDGREYRFFHLSGDNQPAIGDRVDARQPIGEVGRTAIPPGAASHVHVEVRENGQPVRVEFTETDPQAGLWSYLRSQPQTTQSEADMMSRYTGQPLDRQPSYSSHPSPAPMTPTPQPQEPSLLQRVWDAIIPSAEAGTMSEPGRVSQAAGRDFSASESGAYEPSQTRRHSGAGSEFGYDESDVRYVPLPETSGHIRPEDSIEGDFQPHEGAEWLWEDHREGSMPPAGPSGTPGGEIYLPSPAPETPAASPASPAGELRSPEIVTPEQMQVEPEATPVPPPPGLTQQEFRRELDRTMQQFREAYEFNRQNPLRLPPPQSYPEGQYEQPAAPRQRDGLPSNMPETNPVPIERYRPLDPSLDGSLQQLAPQTPPSGYQPQPQQRQNRVYRSDGYSYPIGSQLGQAQQQFQQMQEWSQEQIRRLNEGRPERFPSGRYYDYGSAPASAVPFPTLAPTPVPMPTPTPAPAPTALQPSSSPSSRAATPTYSIGFDDNAPRQGRSRFGYDETPRQRNVTAPEQAYQVPDLPSGGGVERRSSGSSAATASLAIP